MVSEYKKPAGPMPAGSVIRRCVSLAPFVQPLFAPLVEPVEILTMPEQRVLRLGNPVALIREDDKLRRNTHHLSCIESSHSLVIRNTEVHAAVDAEDRGVPLRNIVNRAVRIMPLGYQASERAVLAS